jgi:hypothetical protein
MDSIAQCLNLTGGESMFGKKSVYWLGLLAVFSLGYFAGNKGTKPLESTVHAESKGRVFELRTYTTFDGKLEALHNRFQNHTLKLLKKHGMTSIGYWTPIDSELSGKTLVYLITHTSREAAKKNWEDFGNDPEWKKVRDASEANGKIVSKVDSLFLEPTAYSPMK